MTKYRYKGQYEVTLVPGQQFTHGWMVTVNYPTEDGGIKPHNELAFPPGMQGANLELLEDAIIIPFPTTRDARTEILPDATGIKINHATYDQLINALPGIGRTAARCITSKNKPEGGYTDFENLKSVNLDLKNINWDELKDTFDFSE